MQQEDKQQTCDDGIPLRFLGDLCRLDYKEGDVFVLMSPTVFSAEQQRTLRAHWEIVMPGTKLIVLGSGMKIATLRHISDTNET